MYILRSVYVGALLLLASTAWLVLTGSQVVRDVGDMARFGLALFEIITPLQLALALFFAAVLAASTVSQEKDRGTLVLLLLTNIRDGELVVGTLLASLLNVCMLLVVGAPVFVLLSLFGGIAYDQIARSLAVTFAAALAAGSIGSTLALWRERTFQAIALTVLVVVFWLGLGEVFATGLFGSKLAGVPAASWAIGISPWRAILAASRPYVPAEPALGPLQTALGLYFAVMALVVIVLNAVAIWQVRRWNTVRETRRVEPAEVAATGVAAHAEPGTAARPVWDNPVLWREMRTWAYGRKILVVRLVYLALAVVAGVNLYWLVAGSSYLTRFELSAALAPLCLLSLVLVNAQAVTSITSERDAKALDLLLVTDLSPKEIVLGKLAGALYNAKEMLAAPLALCVYLVVVGSLSLENFCYLIGALVLLFGFAATLGLHVGMNYANSRSAIAVSLGTLFFLFVGVATCMRMMVAFSGSFQAQLQPFLAFMVGGGVGLYVALGARNPSTAIGLASFLCPIATFYALASLLLDYTLAVFLVTAGAYGFATAAMLVPAIHEFDVATGRTTANEE